jgi:hypothetical protein
VNSRRRIGAGPGFVTSSGTSGSIQLAFQSAGCKSPVSHQAGALHTDARPAPSQTRTCQKYRRADESGGPS